MRNLSGLLVVVLISGCTSSDAHPFAPGSTGEVGTPNLTILLNVTGDPQSGPEQYGIMLDGTHFTYVEPNNERPFVISNGTHVLNPYSSVSGLFPSWCTSTGEVTYTGVFRGDVKTHVIFSIDCPSLEGVGGLQLSVEPPANRTATQYNVTFTRLNGVTETRSVSVTSGSPIDIQLSAGYYRVRAGTCSSLGAAIAYQPAMVAIKSGATISLKVSPCS